MDILMDIILPVSGLLFVIGFSVYLLKKSFEYDEKTRQKMMDECSRVEAEILSRKMKESKVEIAVKKPQSFKTKRKTQKRLDK